MVIIFRLLLAGLILFLIYSACKYLFNPKRKLELAKEKKQFFLLDDKENVRKNFFLTYKGVLFEGEKYLGMTKNSFEVVSILISAESVHKLQGFTIGDITYLEEKIKEHYPFSTVNWKSPINELYSQNKE